MRKSSTPEIPESNHLKLPNINIDIFPTNSFNTERFNFLPNHNHVSTAENTNPLTLINKQAI